jgi:5,6-dimethylbenzimidazole synthase
MFAVYGKTMMEPLNGKFFTSEEVAVLQDIILHRRDVRGNHFIDRPLDQEVVDQLLTAAIHAPSVGFSQPWEFVLIKDIGVRRRIKESFDEANTAAAFSFGHREIEYARLKLEGILEAPLNIAVFYRRPAGPVLGQTSMAETGLYSVVCAVQNMWLMARALNIGMGWVSILDEARVKQIVQAPDGSRLVAYLCIGYTDGFYAEPELQLRKWEKRREWNDIVRTI